MIFKWLSILMCFVLLSAVPPTEIFSQAYFDSVFTEYFRRESGGWTAGDATISVPLSDKRVIWLFGDSYIVDVDTTDNTLPCLFQIRNCMMVQDSVDRNLFITHYDSTESGIYRTTFKLPDFGGFRTLWPGHGFEYNDTVYIFLEHVDGATMEFLDTYVVKLAMPELEIVGMVNMPDMGEFIFGRCVLTDSLAGYRYIYGNKVNWIVQEPFVARCPLDGLFDPWEFWTGNNWSADFNLGQKISELPVSPSYSVIKTDNKYHIITQQNGYLTCGLGREIYSYESDSPTGPFVNKTLLYTEESMFNERYLLTYNAYSHPSFTENGELLISYNVNDWVDTLEPYVCPSQCVHIWTDRMDADTYRPQFIRVPLDLITGSDDPDMPHKATIVSPNPVRAGKPVRIQGAWVSTETEMEIFDLSGRRVAERAAPDKFSGAVEFSAPEKPGVYFIRFRKIPGEGTKLVVLPE